MATIQGVYIALFGRPADPTGLAYFNSVTNNGANLSAIGNLAGQPEYTARFAGQNNTQIVNSIYQSLFGRDAEAAGLNFFVDALNKGTLTINNIAIAILDGAQGSDKTIVTNKVAAADLYTKSLDTAAEIGSYVGNAAAAQGRAFITSVTTTVPTQATVDAAITTMVAAGAAGNTITATGAFTTLNLTTGIGAAGDVKTTTNNNDTINAGTNYAPTTSKIDAGLGTDTLNATVNGLAVATTGVVVADGLKNVEVANFSTVTAASGINVANAKELTQVWHVANADSAVAEQNLDVAGVAATTTVGVRGDIDAGATTTFAYAETAGTNTANVAFDNAKAGTVTIADTEVLNVANTGTSSVSTLTVDAAQTINVSGSGSLTLGVAGSAATLTTVNASSFTGALTFDATANNALKTITTGAGGDKVTIDGVHSNDITINTGAGADSITVTAGAATKALTLTGGEGADQFILGSAAVVGNVQAVDTNANFVKTLITVSDFDKASDAIKIVAGGATSRDVILTAEQADISTATDLFGAATKAASYTDLNKISTFQYGADTYLFVNSGTAALDAGDTLVKVTGVNVADLTATNFQIS